MVTRFHSQKSSKIARTAHFLQKIDINRFKPCMQRGGNEDAMLWYSPSSPFI